MEENFAEGKKEKEESCRTADPGRWTVWPGWNIRQELREFNRLYKRLDDLYHSLSLKMGMSDSTFIILYTIAELGDGCSQKEICEQVSISKQTINSSIRKLEGSGVIRLEKGTRGRELHILLTEGRKTDHKGEDLSHYGGGGSAFTHMPAEDRRNFCG